jgi:RNA polymerase primary sigma factor
VRRPLVAPTRTLGRFDDQAGSQTDLIGLYLREIGRYPLLTREEEDVLSMISLDPGTPESARAEAHERLVRGNLRLVVAIAKEFGRGRVPLMDLVLSGNDGLWVACQRFDYRKGVPLANYASNWIKQRVQKTLAEMGYATRLPPYRSSLLNMVSRTEVRMMQTLGRTPTPDEVTQDLNLRIAAAARRPGNKRVAKPVTLSEVTQMMSQMQPALQLDAPVTNDSDVTVLDSWFGESRDDAEARVDQHLNQIDQRDGITAALSALREREAQVLTWVYGLQGARVREPHHIAKMLGVTEERVRQIKMAALRKLRDHPALLGLRGG